MEGTPEQLAARAKLREKHLAAARTGGKGSARLVRRRPGGGGAAGGRGGMGGAAGVGGSPSGEERKVMATVRKMGINELPQMDDVIFYRDDGQAMVFSQPKVQAALGANTFVVTGHHEVKPASQIRPLAPEIDAETLKKIADEFQKLQRKAAEAAAAEKAANKSATDPTTEAATTTVQAQTDGGGAAQNDSAAAVAAAAAAGTTKQPAGADDDIPELVDNFETVD